MRPCTLIAFLAPLLGLAQSLPPNTAAREEFQKLYERLDAAYGSGSLDEIAALALPDAHFGNESVRQPISAVLANLKSALTRGSRFTSRATVTAVQFSGDEAVVAVQTEGEITAAGGGSAYESTSRDTWTRTAAGWKLRESVQVSMRAMVPKTDPATAKAVVAELKREATPLATVVAGGRMDDLAAFAKAVGNSRLVALGEASHGTREFFQMKHRLLEYLAKERGFTVFAMEAINWPEALAIDRYIKNGEGDAKTVLSRMSWVWNTEEVLGMIEWMRTFNQAPGAHPILTFTTFDMQTGQMASKVALDYLKQYSAADAPAAEAAYADMVALDRTTSDKRAQNASERAAAVLKVFDAKRAEMEKASLRTAWIEARQAAAIAFQACTMRIPGRGSPYRDEMMAKNVEWLADTAYPGEKIVLWAHNGHVRFGSDVGGKSMGTWLRERFGRNLYVVGFAFERGQVRAIGVTNGQRHLADQTVPPAPEGSGGAMLSAAGVPLFFLDMSSLAANSPLGRWLAESHLYYNEGAVWQTKDAEANLSLEALSKSYDGLIFVEEGHAAHGLVVQP